MTLTTKLLLNVRRELRVVDNLICRQGGAVLLSQRQRLREARVYLTHRIVRAQAQRGA